MTLVERGGKMKDKARLGVRFHTLVLADGDQVPFRTDAIFREGRFARRGERPQDRRRGGRRRDYRRDHRRREGRGDWRRHGRRRRQRSRDGRRPQRRDAPCRDDRHRSTDGARCHRRRARAVARTVPFHHPGECRYRTNGSTFEHSSPGITPSAHDNYFDPTRCTTLRLVEFHGHTACSRRSDQADRVSAWSACIERTVPSGCACRNGSEETSCPCASASRLPLWS